MKFREVITSVAAITAFIVVMVAPQAAAQGQSKRPARPKTTDRRVTIPPVTVLNNPEYLSGEASISVAANSNPLLRIGMAQNGVTLIEFPVSDKFFAVHAGNSDLVTIEKSPSLKRDHHLVLRAGSGFLVPDARAKTSHAVAPATSIVAQMDSGMAITIMVYPVPLLKQQAHRVVISYKTEEVVRARRAADLATNLTGPGPSTENTSAKIELTVEQPVEPQGPAEGASSLPLKPDYGPPAEAALSEAVKNPKWFRQWTRQRHGLSISVLPARELSDTARLVVFAVHNVTFEPLRVISGYPDLYVETLNEKRRPVEAGTRVPKLHLASSNANDSSIRAGAIRYFALVYEVPVLGVSQHLKLVVAHMSADDEPATADLTKPAK
ncbi:MAG TPA: hypothetical protein VJT15_24870 [Pyrinomonadaceae bacterium]|nr:hypothetical protein [Pyrinomonadaceae bacterium]